MAWDTWATFVLAAIQTVYTILAYYKKHSGQQATNRKMTPLVKMSILSAVTWILIGLSFYYQQNHALIDIPAIQDFAKNFTKYTEVYQGSYAHKTVTLDGLRCHSCTFDNVTFQWDGTAPFDLIDSTFIGGILKSRVQSSNPIVTGTLTLMRDLGYLNPGVSFETQPWSPQSR